MVTTTTVDGLQPSAPISIATPSRDSLPFTSTKGLLNGPGQNNCFLNSAVQVLWHLDIFRRSFRDLSGHACMAESCIFCALKELFAQLQSSPETALPPDALRRALADTFLDQNRFQLGAMDDAAECFENMLLRVHAHVAPHEAEDACAAKHCVPHRKFAMTLVEQARCVRCGAASDPLAYTQMIHYVSTSTLVYQVRANSGRPNQDTFGQLLQKAGSMGDVRTCPGSCGAVIQIGRTLTNHPEIISVGLVWNSERPSLEHIMEVFSTIGTSLRLGDVFDVVKENRWTDVTIYNLVGVVTYYGKHYSTFFFHTKLRVWIYFDDATVREVGPRWEQVVDKCRKGRYQPLLLLYASPDGTPVNTENAPKQITPFYANKITNNQQSLIRRAVTPSPEKPMIGTTRRAITPNPENSPLNQKPPLPRPYNEYQNLSVIQKSIYPTQPQDAGVDVVDGCLSKREPDYITRKALEFSKSGKVNVHRTLSNGSSSGIEGMCIPDHMNVPRRRDSGNWSGDRNSASSASSTTMENPYLYLVGKVPHSGGSVPSSPTRIKSDSSSGSSGVYDAGYDSYSLSSNDSSSMSTLQHLMKMGHLAKIPEDYNTTSTNQTSQSCDILCDEADELLVKSRQLEDEHDLVLALALCNAAATKARAAMNAPYNNPQTLTLARMKHNTCIMRARSLHRRMTQTQNLLNKDNPPEIRHTREGSSSSGRHSRQNSKDKGQHSRQNSRELLIQEKEKCKPTKSIEIYATLPKKKDALKAKMNAINIEDEEYMIYDKSPGMRESRSIFSRSKNKDQKIREKRSRSEDRNKLSRDFSIAPEIITSKDTLKKAKEVKEKDDKVDKDGKSKKQHKIRRKLLMGGLIKRKNRSMPDLTEGNNVEKDSVKTPSSTVDDSSVGLKTNDDKPSGMCGYLSEGHLEFTGSTTNPNLERSKLMRKSFHCSAGKILTAAKVPPPPPLRTTSQLSKSKLKGGEVSEENGERSKYPLPDEVNQYQNTQQYNFNVNSPHFNNEGPVSLPHYHNNSSYDEDSFYNPGNHIVVTRADIHQEQSPLKSPSVNTDSGVDEVDCLPSHIAQVLELPPYPSPGGSAIHSRQASEEFPPPPPPLDLSALDEHLTKPPQAQSPPPSSYLLSQLQHKRQQIMCQETDYQSHKNNPVIKPTGDTWLKELQAKQAALKMKKSEIVDNGVDEVNTQRYLPGENNKNNSVKDLASKFENTEAALYQKRPVTGTNPVVSERLCDDMKPEIHQSGVLLIKRREDVEVIGPEQIAEEIREVEMLNAAMNKPLNNLNEILSEENRKNKLGKKKSVSFCDQVILVATAEEQEDDSYIPNPILERVLRSAGNNKSDVAAIRQEIQNLRDNNCKHQENTAIARNVDEMAMQQPLYVRRNSVENLLNKQNSQEQNIPQEIYNGQNNNYKPVVPANYPDPTPMDNNNVPGNQSPHYFNNSSSYANPQNNYQQTPQYNQNYILQQNLSLNRPIAPQSQHVRQADIVQQTRQIQHTYPPNAPVQHTQYPPNYNGEAPYHNPQYNAPANDPTAYRQSPYQPIPPNSAAYVAYYRQNGITNNSPQNREYNPQPPYSSSPRYHQMQNIRQTTPSPMGYLNGAYQHPPSPAPSIVSSNYNYHQNMYRGPTNPNFENAEKMAYQRVSPLGEHPQNFLRPQNEYDTMQAQPPYQRVPQPQQYQDRVDPYQRVPPPHGEQDAHIQQPQLSNGKYSPYQHVMPPKQLLKKTVSFEPGTKGGCESPTPKAVVTPIIVNNANNSVPTDKTKCNLCRKKNVAMSNLYCQDCEFYMSRFKPRS